MIPSGRNFRQGTGFRDVYPAEQASDGIRTVGSSGDANTCRSRFGSMVLFRKHLWSMTLIDPRRIGSGCNSYGTP